MTVSWDHYIHVQLSTVSRSGRGCVTLHCIGPPCPCPPCPFTFSQSHHHHLSITISLSPSLCHHLAITISLYYITISPSPSLRHNLAFTISPSPSRRYHLAQQDLLSPHFRPLTSSAIWQTRMPLSVDRRRRKPKLKKEVIL